MKATSLKGSPPPKSIGLPPDISPNHKKPNTVTFKSIPKKINSNSTMNIAINLEFCTREVVINTNISC